MKKEDIVFSEEIIENRPWPVASEQIGVPQKSVRTVHVADHVAVAAHVETATIWGTRGKCFIIDKDVDGNTQVKASKDTFTIREIDFLVVLAGVCPGQRHCGEKDYR